jgi:hypothetical protein
MYKDNRSSKTNKKFSQKVFSVSRISQLLFYDIWMEFLPAGNYEIKVIIS